ncbi:uncharacterized protein K452DRAFT_296883 [Aplosporella prunicola CBS 121167]|uniref:G-protein coupled receptors family 1 profile domain-containing protein n=1 Tax=Aplosporella prunicola CBS 121167 TaxID=1176127 RepID=A0A6A6BIF0_9PEZI|nr:uncharacterized protein K452DRAFT_296883 [Aplosporella prunicola CBS 121167]KAF2143922.1 hypothetical protein K452DRAFT_296883 [Aplosporella prunicola CBS 121167]
MDAQLLARHGNAVDGNPDVHTPHILFTSFSMVCMAILALLFGSRVKHVCTKRLSKLNPMRCIVAGLYAFGMCYVATSAIIQCGFGMMSHKLCFTAAVTCLAFYLGSKTLLYLFLVERTHAIRASYKRRFQDKYWIVSMAIVLLGFGALAACGLMSPMSEMSKQDGICYIGVPQKIAAPFLAYDVAINVGFTGLFICLLWPLLRFHQKGLSSAEPIFPRPYARNENVDIEMTTSRQTFVDPNKQRVIGTLKKLLWKTIIGAILVMLPTVGNLTVSLIVAGHGQGWYCFILCICDVTWEACVIHWLTVDPDNADNRGGNSNSQRSSDTTGRVGVRTSTLRQDDSSSKTAVETTERQSSMQ